MTELQTPAKKQKTYGVLEENGCAISEENEGAISDSRCSSFQSQMSVAIIGGGTNILFVLLFIALLAYILSSCKWPYQLVHT